MTVPAARRSAPRPLWSMVLAAVLLVSVLTTPGRAQSAGASCAAPVPIDEIAVGFTGSGLTVTKGTTPEPFGAEVLGVLRDGIAPGIDMIIADLTSPAIAAAGVWAGMSGSPVYAADGRLIGAVSYGLSADPSSIAGLTPAAQMTKLYDYPDSTRSLSLDQRVDLPDTLARRAAAASDATLAEVRQGLTPVPVPVGVSGVRASRLSEIEKRLERRIDIAPYRSGSVSGAPGDPSEIFPGSNIAAALSHGDLTVAGLGTTTDVCDGMAVAFGHPFLWDGRTSMSAHTAEAITIQPDSGFGISYKLANPGGVVGTVDQDRLTGLRTRFGEGPTPAAVTSTLASRDTGEERTGRTVINRDEFVPDLTSVHMLVNLDRIIDMIGEGRSQLTWTATGTDGSGDTWTVVRDNRFAGRFDISFESILELSEWLHLLETNQFSDVTFTRIHATGSTRERFDTRRLGAARVKVNDGRWRRFNSISRLRPRAGDTIRTRVRIKRDQSDEVVRTITQRLRIPRSWAGRSFRLGVFGGARLQGETNPAGATSFADLLWRMQRQDSNNDVVMRFQRGGDDGPNVLRTTTRRIGNVVTGRRSLAVTVR